MLTAKAGERLQRSFRWLISDMEVNIYFAIFSGYAASQSGGIVLDLSSENFIKECDTDGLFSLVLSEDEVAVCAEHGSVFSFAIYGKQPYLERALICKGTLEIEST